jgi:hypothetical protein
MPRFTTSGFVKHWMAIPGSKLEKIEIFGRPSDYAREMMSDEDALTREEIGIRVRRSAESCKDENQMRIAFDTYFKSTPEGLQEGRWLNEPHWIWKEAGCPAKIKTGEHPDRPTAFEKFREQWAERAATGKPMPMKVLPPPPRKRYGKSV